jgi:cyclophilin family peptidyl-prolyl cis-trans isomerase
LAESSNHHLAWSHSETIRTSDGWRYRVTLTMGRSLVDRGRCLQVAPPGTHNRAASVTLTNLSGREAPVPQVSFSLNDVTGNRPITGQWGAAGESCTLYPWSRTFNDSNGGSNTIFAHRSIQHVGGFSAVSDSFGDAVLEIEPVGASPIDVSVPPLDADGVATGPAPVSRSTTTSTPAPGLPALGSGGAVSLIGPGGGATLGGPTPCPNPDGSSARTTGFSQAPPMCIDSSKEYSATFATTKGTMVVALDAKDYPVTVNNFVVLAQYHFYDGSPFFRLVKDFAAQFGDPSAHPSNAAQFGYTIPDEFPTGAAYKVGTLAMANTGQANSGGAQAFFVTGPEGKQLPDQYAVVGQVVKGLDVLQAINSVRSVASASNDGAPTEQVTITSVTVTTS